MTSSGEAERRNSVFSLRALFSSVFSPHHSRFTSREERLESKGQRFRSTIYSLLYQRIIVKQNDELERWNSSRFRRRPFRFLSEFRFVVFSSPEFTSQIVAILSQSCRNHTSSKIMTRAFMPLNVECQKPLNPQSSKHT